MANGKYTFEDMAAEKSNKQDLDAYIRKMNPQYIPPPDFDWYNNPSMQGPSVMEQILEDFRTQKTDLQNKISQNFSPTRPPTLIEQGIPLGQRRAIEAAAAAEAQQAAIRDQIRSGTGIASRTRTGPQSRGGTQSTPTSATPAFDPEAARMMMNVPANASTFEQTQVVQPPPQTQRPVTGPAPTTTETTDPDLTAIQDAATGDVDPVNTFLKMLEKMESDDARAQWGFDQGIINADVLGELRAQEAANQPMNINLGVNDVKVDGFSAGQKAIFQWGEPDETGTRTIEMMPEPSDGAEEIVEESEITEEEEVTTEEELGEVVLEEEDQYLNDQLEILTETYNDRVEAIQTAVEDGNTDINNAQIAFNEAKDILFDQMAELNKATYGTVADEFQARTTQRGTDVADMLALLAEQGVEQNLIQDVIGGDIGMNLAGYGEETDAMRDFMGALELIGQQGASEAEMLGNYMFDSYRQDLDTTGRNMELQSAMQMLAEQQSAAEQNLQSQLLGPYFGLDPEMMMAGMGAGVDMAGYAEGRTARDDAADMAYQDNVWDYMMSQTMTPYQSGMLQVAQDEQQMDTLSSLMGMMQPSGATAQAVADQNLYDAVMELQQGYIPATGMAPSPANNFMGASTPASTALERMTPAMLSALEGSDFALGDYLVDQARQEQEMFATVSLADAIGMDPMQLIGASQEGILNELIKGYTFEMTGSGFNATASDPSLEFPIPPTDLNPAGSVEMVDLSKYKDMLDIYYPNWDGPAEERTFEMMTPSGQTISVGAELSDLGAYVEFLMNAGLPQDQILQYVQGMIPIGTATGE